MRGKSRISRGGRVVCAALLPWACLITHATTYTVNTTVDPPDQSASRCDPGNVNTCSLRDAVYATKYAYPESDRIVFDPALPQLTLTRPITLNTIAGTDTTHVIDGGGIVIDGGGSTRLFTTEMPAGGFTGGGGYRLVGLTLSNGSADLGAAVYRPNGDGTILDSHNIITLDHCRLENNHATDAGGALHAGDGGFTVIATTFSGNMAANRGGAIWADGPTTIDASTFVGNSSGSGGAIYTQGGALRITNSTLTGNVATQANGGGGIYSDASPVALVNVTLWGNTGLSLLQFGSIDINDPPPPSTITNTIVENCLFLFTTNLSGSNNLSQDGLCQLGIPGTGAGHALLVGLDDNGGPTQTMLPGIGSAAIDAGDDTFCAGLGNRDQRGAPRPFGPHCDIGAVEAGASFTLDVSVVGNGTVSAGGAPTGGGIVDCGSGSGTCSAQYLPNVMVPLIATPMPGAYFAGWSGDAACTIGSVTMNGDHACTATFTPNAVTGTIAGLAGSGLVMHLDYDSGSEDLPLVANATAFAFATAVPTGAPYSVSVGIQPDGPRQLCAVGNGSGVLPAGGVDDVAVTCVRAYAIGGSVSGLVADGLVLALNGSNDLPVASGSSSFMFAPPLTDGSAYAVTLEQQPAGALCTLANASGTVAAADVVDVDVSCVVAQAQLALSITDSIDFARYGDMVDYVVTLTNSGNAGATAVPVSASYSAAFDLAHASWTCIDGGNGATCTASGTGAFADSVDLPPDRSLTWLVSVPILQATTASSANIGVSATGAGPASDSDTLVILRDGWDTAVANAPATTKTE